ncbi:ArsC/Spx/MgsR family protein, partial [Pseudomonas aeruginosa]
MSELILLHNPRCSKSRAALELLEARGLQPQVVRYLETPPRAAELKATPAKLRPPARLLLGTGGDEYQAPGLHARSRDDEPLREAMARHPRWMERPVLVARDKALVG